MNINNLKEVVITANQMQEIERKMFAQGMPIASLMEKAALLCSQKINQDYPLNNYQKIGFLIGNGHNGGDGLVIARELFLKSYQVKLYTPLAHKSKDLTAQHLQYAHYLELDFVNNINDLKHCDLIIDCFFGFGLNRPINNFLADDILSINSWKKLVISIDLPSGIHTDTGEVLGVAIKASHTLCLGLWKLGLFQFLVWQYTGKLDIIDIGIPEDLISAIINKSPTIKIITSGKVKAVLPIPRAINTHKYKQGNLLLICGSQKYAGAALLSGYGAKTSGVGMLTLAVPESLRMLILNHLPFALVIGLSETNIETFPSEEMLSLNKYDTIVFGMGISQQDNYVIEQLFEQILNSEKTLIIDADGFYYLLKNNFLELLSNRKYPTILTPHDGEFKRLFPDLDLNKDRFITLQKAAKRINSTILLKGTKTMISYKGEKNWIINESTSALARGGSGDVLSGFIGGLIAQTDLSQHSIDEVVATAGWLHQRGGILAAKNHTQMGVDGVTLADYINKAIKQLTIDN
ncbi:NAD(P)HX epimerase [Geminocystis sp. NIES-3708]|uniref:bifunctional ADP-dependent NAD(P)H-hydrate dehydratase/NAD(P)H-hydrate epimerase n=1 Tax=Geminocystis sp. NIES-3708 TaxID=1615909 RepID=UPI0005FC87E3|nr:bifunctional ADP-dependent NAD(P)H-hydrate dehydratase/NAD(P)H-hydrate epimerase [Geminocystis sp. NIES-3708]BAQ62504.1 NAD(P)HX epimerase [Geminocystis sp. NIES-3708]